MSSELSKRIQVAVASTAPLTKERNKALAAVKWVLKVSNTSNDLYCKLSPSLECVLTPDLVEAQVFDGRDNETTKLAFWSDQVGEPLEIFILP